MVRRTAQVVALGVVAALLWIVVTAVIARHEANEVRADLTPLKSFLAAGDAVGADRLVTRMQREAASARSRTHDPVWAAGAAIPGLGTPLRTVRSASDVLDGLASTALPAAARAGAALDPQTLRPGRIHLDVAQLRAAQPAVTSAAAAAAHYLGPAMRVPRSWLGPADGGRSELLSSLSTLSTGLDDLALATQLLPGPLGADGPRHYLVVFVGRQPSTYAVMDTTDGRFRFRGFGSSLRLLGDPTTATARSGASVGMPAIASEWLSQWRSRTGQRLDGALVVGPAALQQLLGSTGAAELPDGSDVTAQTVTSLLDTRPVAERVAATRAVTGAVIHEPVSDLLATGSALQRSVDAGDLLVYVTDRGLESTLRRHAIAGVPVTR